MQETHPIGYTPHADVLSAFNQAPVAIALYEGQEYRLRFCNARYRELIGKTPTIGHTIYEIAPEMRGSEFEEYLQEVMHKGTTVAKDGKSFVMEADPDVGLKQLRFNFSYSPWRDESGHIRGVLMIVVDTSQQAEAMAKLAAVDRRMRAMADAMPHAVYICDAVGNLRYVNDRWKKFTGQNEGTWSLETWPAMVHPEDRLSVESRWAEATTSRGLFDVYARLKQHASGDYRWQRLMGRSYHELGPTDEVWVGTWTDVHERVVNDIANAAAQKQFIATLSHDLRNPLAGIRASVENIQRNKEAAAPFAQKLCRIVDTIERADSMLESLLDIDRVISGNLAGFVFAPLDLHDLMGVSLANHAASYGPRFVVHIPKGVVGQWHGATLSRAIDNLVGNAFKYGGAETPVTLTVEHDATCCRIKVHNLGNPIALEDQERVFVPYARGSSVNSKGWGLGLSMVLGVAKVHRGTIKVTSDAAAGTTFTLTLPKASPKEAASKGGGES